MTSTYCDVAGDHVVHNLLSPRDLVPDLTNRTYDQDHHRLCLTVLIMTRTVALGICCLIRIKSQFCLGGSRCPILYFYHMSPTMRKLQFPII